MSSDRVMRLVNKLILIISYKHQSRRANRLQLSFDGGADFPWFGMAAKRFFGEYLLPVDRHLKHPA